MTDAAIARPAPPAPNADADAPLLDRVWRGLDRRALVAALLLFALGLILALAASPPLAERLGRPYYYFALRQGVFGGLGLAALGALACMSPRQIRRIAALGLAATLTMLLLLPLIGSDHGKGAIRWLSLGGMSLQPSEFLKPCLIVFCAWLLSARVERHGPPGALLSLSLVALICALLAMQPDFGQATLIAASWGAMYFAAGAPALLILMLGFGGAGAAFLAYQGSEHVARRIDAYLAQDVDPFSQIGFATNAIRSGGLTGVGVGEGQVKWSLADAHTDFIAAVAAEEFGLLFVLALIALFAVVALSSMLRAAREPDLFVRLAALGLSAQFALQAIVNLGVAARLLPAKGMTLPLISYGGSSMIATCAGLGMLLAMTRERSQIERARDRAGA